MNSKSTYFNNNSNTATSQPEKTSTDSLLPPKTPIKRNQLQPQPNISSCLSPFFQAPKLQARTGLMNFIPFEEMCQIETPLAKQKSKFMIDAEQEQMDYAIIGRIIFESQEEEGQESSSQMESQQDSQRNEEEKQHLSNSQEEEESYSQMDRSKEERHYEANDGGEGGNSARRPSKNRLKVNLNNENTPGKKISCNCKKTKCLKLYCDCFRLNQTCDGCNCVGCHNLQVYSNERNNAIIALMDRNPDPFGQKIEADKHVKGCNCKKSNCLKKYCECYQAGLKCGQNCKCEQCKNIILEKGNQQEKLLNKNTAKKERKMLEI